MSSFTPRRQAQPCQPPEVAHSYLDAANPTLGISPSLCIRPAPGSQGTASVPEHFIQLFTSQLSAGALQAARSRHTGAQLGGMISRAHMPLLDRLPVTLPLFLPAQAIKSRTHLTFRFLLLFPFRDLLKVRGMVGTTQIYIQWLRNAGGLGTPRVARFSRREGLAGTLLLYLWTLTLNLGG